MENETNLARLTQIMNSTEEREIEGKCQDYIEFTVMPEYRAATKQLTLKFKIKAKQSRGVIETFGASVNFKIPGGRREAQCNGTLNLSEYVGEVIILPVDLGSGSHKGGYVIGGFVEIDGVSTLCLESNSFDFQIP